MPQQLFAGHTVFVYTGVVRDVAQKQMEDSLRALGATVRLFHGRDVASGPTRLPVGPIVVLDIRFMSHAISARVRQIAALQELVRLLCWLPRGGSPALPVLQLQQRALDGHGPSFDGSASVDPDGTIVRYETCGGKPPDYNTKRVTRSIAAELEFSPPPDARGNPAHPWSSYLAWTNLYRIAPAGGGNPGARLCARQLKPCLELFRRNVERLQVRRHHGRQQLGRPVRRAHEPPVDVRHWPGRGLGPDHPRFGRRHDGGRREPSAEVAGNARRRSRGGGGPLRQLTSMRGRARGARRCRKPILTS